MKWQRSWWMAGMMLVLTVWPLSRLNLPVPAMAQQPGASAPQNALQNTDNSTPVIKAETRLVLVDTVVTDKKGNYIDTLTEKDFKVWEDDKEQTIKTFSVESGPAAPNVNRRHYLVLFFDNTTVSLSDQGRARDAAAKFIEANAGPDRYIALVEYGGTVRVAENFTDNVDKLKAAVKNLQFSFISPNGTPNFSTDPSLASTSMGAGMLAGVEGDYAAHTLLLAIRSVARSMAGVPGRKSLVLLTSGFPMTPERQAEMPAVIDTCNKANVAIYPIDVRGLVAPVGAGGGARMFSPSDFRDGGLVPALWRGDQPARLVTAVLDADDDSAHLLYVQRGGGGSGGGHSGGGSGGGTGTGGSGSRGTGGTGGTGGRGTGGTGSSGNRGGSGNSGHGTTTPGYYPGYNPNLQPHLLVPDSSALASTNQEVMFQLANGTGGFMIVNSNDLLAGLQKIAREQTEYYVLGYTPAPSSEGACHQLKVKVERSGTVVRSRSGYCNVRPTDLLAGKAEGKQLEDRVSSSAPGSITATMRAPYFFVTNNTARVNLAMDIPGSAIKFEKEKGKYHATLNILGIAYKQGGTVSARFSDSVNLNLDDKKEVEELNKKPFHYENQFDVASGSYDLKVGFTSGGDSFGKLEMPLVVDSYEADKFNLSAVALSRDFHAASQMAVNMDAALLEDRIPLISKDVQFIPAGAADFNKTDNAGFYLEVYDPLLNSGKPPKVGLSISIVDRNTGKQAIQSGGDITADARPGTPVIPVGLRLPVSALAPGSYRLDIKAMDTAGNNSQLRSVDFEVR